MTRAEERWAEVLDPFNKEVEADIRETLDRRHAEFLAEFLVRQGMQAQVIAALAPHAYGFFL